MRLIGSIIIIALLLLGVFLLLNWSAMTVPTQLSFLFFETKGSPGLIFLGITLLFSVLFISYTLTLRTRMLMEGRRHTNELEAQRKLAENAEMSRFDQLREQITLEFAQMRTADLDAHDGLRVRIEDMDQSLRKSLDEAANSLSASMGEMEEKLDRALERIVV